MNRSGRMQLLGWQALVLAMLLIGSACKSGASVSEPTPEVRTNPSATSAPPANPTDALLEQMRSGGYQLDAAMGGMERAMNRVRPLVAGKPAETREALQNIADYLDGAGATVIDYVDAPSRAAIEQDFAKEDDRRLKAIEATNDAWRDVDNARDVVSALIESDPPADVRKTLEEIQASVEQSLDALEGAIEAFGGKLDRPVDEAPPDPSSTTPSNQ